MIYDIRHLTTYRYASPVASARCTLRLAPAQDTGQRVIAHEVTVSPAPASRVERPGFAGGRSVFVTIAEPHGELRIEARSRVEVTRRAPAATSDRAWEEVRDLAYATTSLGPDSPAHYLFPSRLATLSDPLTRYAGEAFGAGQGVLAGATALMKRMRAEFAFDPRATDVTTPPATAFARRRGVCQDFAHVMIAGLRGLGLPAAYVSGYIRTDPPPGQPRLQGADATHAWVDLWCGPELGWIGLDPTNGIQAGDAHIVLTTGRDYADVSPVDGVIVGGGAQSVQVAVDVVPVAPGRGALPGAAP